MLAVDGVNRCDSGGSCVTEIIDVSPLAKRKKFAAVARLTAMVMGLLVVLVVSADLSDRGYGLALVGIFSLTVMGFFVYLGFAAARGYRLASGILATILALFFVSVPSIIILQNWPPNRGISNPNLLEELGLLLFGSSILIYPLLAVITLAVGQRVGVATPLGVVLADSKLLKRRRLRFWRGVFNLWRIGLAILAICVLVGVYNWILGASWGRGIVVGLVLLSLLWMFDGVLFQGALYALALDYFTKRPEEILEQDRRPIVLYLRSFGDETVQIKRSILGESMPFSFENLMVQALWETGPVVSVGDPTDMTPMFGAARVYLADDEWQAHVTDWIDQAGLIVVLVGKTAGLEWEYRQIGALQQSHKVMFLFAPLSKNEVKVRWLQLRSLAQTALGFDLPQEVEFKKLMGLVVDPAGQTTLIVAKRRSYGAYQVMFTFATELVKARSNVRPAAAGQRNEAASERRRLSRAVSGLQPPLKSKTGVTRQKQQNVLRRALDYMRGIPELEELAARRRAQWQHARRTGSRWQKFIQFYFRDRRNRRLYLVYNLKATIFLIVIVALCSFCAMFVGVWDSLAR